MMPGDDSLVFKSWVDPEGQGKLVLTEQTWHGSSTSANMCRNKVLFSQGGYFFFPSQLGKAQQCTGNKIFSVFSFPKNTIKGQRRPVCILNERKEERSRFIWEGSKVCPPLIHLSNSQVVSLVVSPEIPPAVLPLFSPLFPHLPFGMCSLWMVSHRGLSPIKNSNLNSWPWCSYCSYMFCFPQRQDRTDDCRYFKMSAWHCGISII